VITDYQKTVSDVVQRGGGFVAKFMGDGVIACFGYPRAQEHDWAAAAAFASASNSAFAATRRTPIPQLHRATASEPDCRESAPWPFGSQLFSRSVRLRSPTAVFDPLSTDEAWRKISAWPQCLGPNQLRRIGRREHDSKNVGTCVRRVHEYACDQRPPPDRTPSERSQIGRAPLLQSAIATAARRTGRDSSKSTGQAQSTAARRQVPQPNRSCPWNRQRKLPAAVIAG
jgi:hypothetical protein